MRTRKEEPQDRAACLRYRPLRGGMRDRIKRGTPVSPENYRRMLDAFAE